MLRKRNSNIAPLNTLQAMVRRVVRLLDMQLDRATPYPAVWAAILSGAGLGLAWGIVARIWMRLISTNPEFSIAGTTAILVITTLFGACVGLAFAARRRGWQRWQHYLPRSLVVIFFLPFGIAGGLPLMLTVLLLTLALTHTAIIGLWVLALLTIFIVIATDIELPAFVAVIMPIAALGFTAWKWLILRWSSGLTRVGLDTWLERIGRTILLLVVALIFGTVVWQIGNDKPGVLALVYSLCYVILLYPLFLALRVGLAPRLLDKTRP